MTKRKKRSLGTRLREWRMSRQYDANRTEQVLDFDWSSFHHNRISVVNLLMAGRPDGRYLEIGCADNVLFDAVLATDKTGVDPVRGGTHRMTSDAFFAAYDGPPFDVIFIDGLHLYPQVRRDLVNALRHLAPGGWIGMHDMLPRDWLEEHVPQIRTSGWTGDGWKAAFELAAAAEIDFRLITIDYGVLVARPTGPSTLPDLSADLADKRFKFLAENLERLPLVAYEEARTWIDSFRALVQRGDSANLAK
ncbi:MAG TPA: class I SAM-dependent methyltransferase [Caulobacteraceae bacterium]